MSPMHAPTRSVHAAIAADGVTLTGTLELPPHAKGVVLFAHGSGSSRLSPRNIFVADALRTAGVGTLLIDLLTPEEANDRDKVFDVRLLALRLLHATDWVESQVETVGMPVGYFGASTDTADDNRAFAESLQLGYPILSDPDRSVARAYGVVGASGFASRWTFYIGKDGRILDIDKDVHPSSHGADVARKLEELGIPRV